MASIQATFVIPEPGLDHQVHTNTRRLLCTGTAERFGVRTAFDLEMKRLRRLGLRGERQFRLAALNVFGRAR